MKKRFHFSGHGLKKWEIALILALGITLCSGFLFGGTECCAWWGTMYPELTGAADAYLPASAVEGPAGVEIRFRIAEWIAALLRWLRGI